MTCEDEDSNIWMTIRNRQFDLTVNSEPFHNIELLVNMKKGQYSFRVWSKTIQTGRVRNRNELVQLCKDTLGKEFACKGYETKMSSGMIQIDYPFTRFVSKRCQFVTESIGQVCVECENEVFGISPAVLVKTELMDSDDDEATESAEEIQYNTKFDLKSIEKPKNLTKYEMKKYKAAKLRADRLEYTDDRDDKIRKYYKVVRIKSALKGKF